MILPDPLKIKVGAIEWRRLAFTLHPSIKAGASLTGTPTVTVTAGGPTLSSKQVDSTGKKVVFLCDATGVTPGVYTITALCATNESTAQTLGGETTIHVF